MLKVIPLLCVLALAACGLQPVYGTHGVGARMSETLGGIAIGNIPDQSGQTLRNHLLDRMYQNGAPSEPAYTLNLSSVQESRKSLGIAKDASVTRSQLELTTTMTRTDRNGEIVLSRPLKAISSYNVLGSQFGTLVTRQDAREQTLNELANQVLTQLELHFAR